MLGYFLNPYAGLSILIMLLGYFLCNLLTMTQHLGLFWKRLTQRSPLRALLSSHTVQINVNRRRGSSRSELKAMDSFVQQKLINWNLECLIEKFADEQIDDESFLLLDENTIATLIPKIGVRLKFLKHFKELKFNSIPPHSSVAPENTQPSTALENTESTSGRTSSENTEPTFGRTSSENTEPTFGRTSSENTEPTIVLQLVPDDMHDIRAILMKAPHGPSIVESLESNKITTQQRRAMVRIIVAHLIERYGETPSTETKKAMAISLVETFSCLRDPEGNGYEAWFSPGRRHRPSTGFLEERLRNIRKRMRRLRTPSSVAFICEKRSTVIPASTLSPERASQLKEWLKNNTRPQDQVEQYMRETAPFRAHWIRENGSKPISEILSEFPRLMDTPGMVNIILTQYLNCLSFEGYYFININYDKMLASHSAIKT
ncbi:hypothetical protein F2P79_025951, partial [Pimephales promelas]